MTTKKLPYMQAACGHERSGYVTTHPPGVEFGPREGHYSASVCDRESCQLRAKAEALDTAKRDAVFVSDYREVSS